MITHSQPPRLMTLSFFLGLVQFSCRQQGAF